MKYPDTGEYIIVGTTEEVRELKRKFDLWKDEKWTVFDIDLDKKVDQWFDSFSNIAKNAKMYVDEDDVRWKNWPYQRHGKRGRYHRFHISGRSYLA